MGTFLLVIGIFFFNYIFGVIVYSYIDKDDSLLQWVDDAPFPTLASILVPSVWPVILYLYWAQGRKK